MDENSAEDAAQSIWNRVSDQFDELSGTQAGYTYGVFGVGIWKTEPPNSDCQVQLSVADSSRDLRERLLSDIARLGLGLNLERDIRFRVTGEYLSLAGVSAGLPVIRKDRLGYPAGPGGSAGSVVLLSSSSDRFLLSAEHVVNDFGKGNAGDPMYWNDPGCTSGCPTFLGARSEVAGPLYTDLKAHNQFDCGLIKLDPLSKVTVDPWPESSGGFGTPRPALLHEPVMKFGPLGKTLGKVAEVLTTGSIVTFLTTHHGATGGRLQLKFEHQLDIESRKGKFALLGDSGSLVVSDPPVGLPGPRREPLGLLFAGSQFENSYLANPIVEVMSKLKIRSIV